MGQWQDCVAWAQGWMRGEGEAGSSLRKHRRRLEAGEAGSGPWFPLPRWRHPPGEMAPPAGKPIAYPRTHQHVGRRMDEAWGTQTPPRTQALHPPNAPREQKSPAVRPPCFTSAKQELLCSLRETCAGVATGGVSRTTQLTGKLVFLHTILPRTYLQMQPRTEPQGGPHAETQVQELAYAAQ